MSRLNDIYKWYTENNTSDPNMFELIEVLSQHSRMPGDYTDEINQLVELETKRLFENGIITDEADPLVMLITEFQQKALLQEAVSKELEEYAKMVAGISFWIKTQLSRSENKEDFRYENNYEYERLLENEVALDNSGELRSKPLRELAEFIAKNNKDVKVPRKQESYHFAEKATNDREKTMIIANDVIPYIYPEKFDSFIEIWKTGGPMIEAVNAIIDLEIGVDYDLIQKRIENSCDGSGISFANGAVLEYAKHGPDYFMHISKGFHRQLTEEELAHIEEIRKQNEEYAKNEGVTIEDMFVGNTSVVEEEKQSTK